MPYHIAFSSDHAGFALKSKLIEYTSELGHFITDLGTNSDEPVDYSDYGYALAKTVSDQKVDFGVAICGSGIGISIAANRYSKVRAALCHQRDYAELARKHNNANILALGGRYIHDEEACACLERFLNTPFEEGRHAERVAKLSFVANVT